MEITTLSEAEVKVKGKQATFAINPVTSKSKITASAALFFERLTAPLDTKHFEEEPLVIQGPGEYEVGGIKFSGNRVGESFTYRITVDGLDILSAKTSSLSKSKESATEYDILLLESDNLADQSVITALNASVVIFYGEKKEENAKAMGREEGSAVSKVSVTREKLPTETQILTLQ
ncbi:MAG TPA: hypothetical protein VLG12_08605 [Candidatus Saccharimonadales bacterium]|nr:hypothetical protein [Candidatus Saccharimonadales bacterium]